MNDQTILLFFLILFTAGTLFLYLWKAKKEVEYKGDERWKAIQYKAVNIANYSNYILLLILGIATALEVWMKISTTIAFNRMILYGLFFIGFRNVLELVALLYWDRAM